MVRRPHLLLLAMFLGLLSTALGGSAYAEEAAKKDEAAEYAKLRAAYPLKTCVVTGEVIKRPAEIMYEGRLVRFCCMHCIDDFEQNPEKYLKILDEAVAKTKSADGEKAEGEGAEGEKKE